MNREQVELLQGAIRQDLPQPWAKWPGGYPNEVEAAQHRWRAVNAPHLVALVRAGATFERGKLVEREDEETATEAA